MDSFEVKALVGQINSLSNSVLQTHIEQLEAASDDAEYMEDSLLAIVAAGLMQTELAKRDVLRAGKEIPQGQDSQINVPDAIGQAMIEVAELLEIEVKDAYGTMLLGRFLHLQVTDQLDNVIEETKRRTHDKERGESE